MFKFAQVSVEKEIMVGLTSPQDIMSAVLSAQKTDARSQDLARLGMKKTGQSFEDILLTLDSKYLRPEMGILNAMDANAAKEEEQRTGRKSSSALDGVISSQVASALSGIYQDPSIRPDLTQDNPFTPAGTFGQITPRLDKKAMQIAKQYGFPVESVFGGATTATGTQSTNDLMIYLAQRAGRAKSVEM